LIFSTCRFKVKSKADEIFPGQETEDRLSAPEEARMNETASLFCSIV
jgi:hypothetical protein